MSDVIKELALCLIRKQMAETRYDLQMREIHFRHDGASEELRRDIRAWEWVEKLVDQHEC